MANGKKSKKKTVKKVNARTKANKQPMHYSAVVVILMLTAILMAIFIYFPSDGALTEIVKECALGLFSVASYIIPPVLFGLGIYVSRVRSYEKLPIKLGLSLLGCALAAAVYQLAVSGKVDYYDLVYEAVNSHGSGGLIGGCIANILNMLVGKAAAVILIIFALLADISVIIKISVFNLCATFISGFFKMREEISEVDYGDRYEQGKRAALKLNESTHNAIPYGGKKMSSIIDEEKEEDTAKKRKPKKERKIEEQEEAVVSEEELKNRIDEIIFKGDIPEREEEKPEEEEDISLGVTLDDAEAEVDGSEERVEKNEKPKRVSSTTEEEKAQISEEIDESIENVKTEYVFPSIELLNKPPKASADKRREMQETANKLMVILKNFGVEAKLLHRDPVLRDMKYSRVRE